MRIVFMSGGARQRSLEYLISKNENIYAVITPPITPKNCRFLEVIDIAKQHNIPVYMPERNQITKILLDLKPDILLSCGYPFILSEESIKSARYAINVHPTLLPKYRGYRSGPYIILNNEEETGVTVHFIEKEMDRGDILIQRKFSLSRFDTQKSIYRKMQSIEPQALYDAIQMIKNDKIEVTHQDESKASEYTYLRTPLDSRIDPTKPLINLYDEIRACDPESFPAFFEIDGQKVCIRLWRPEKPNDENDMI